MKKDHVEEIFQWGLIALKKCRNVIVNMRIQFYADPKDLLVHPVLEAFERWYELFILHSKTCIVANWFGGWGGELISVSLTTVSSMESQLFKEQAYIGGSWSSAKSGQTFIVR